MGETRGFYDGRAEKKVSVSRGWVAQVGIGGRVGPGDWTMDSLGGNVISEYAVKRERDISHPEGSDQRGEVSVRATAATRGN